MASISAADSVAPVGLCGELRRRTRERGVIRAKGLINSREHLDSLFNAKELGVGSVQDYLRDRVAVQPGERA